MQTKAIIIPFRATCVAIIMLLTTVLSTPGCAAFKGEQVNLKAHYAADGLWHPAAMDMRIYPSSRYARIDNQLIIEARVEFVDEMGDPTKDSGRLRFELHHASKASDSDISQPLYQWDINLSSLEDHQATYDAITQAYLFRLKLNQYQPPAEPTTLSVIFMRPATNRLEASATLSPPAPAQSR